MKKVLLLILALFLSLSLVACTPKENNPTPDDGNGGSEGNPDDENKGNEGDSGKKEDLNLVYDNEEDLFDLTYYTETDKKYTSGAYHLANNIQDGVILHAWNWSYNEIKNNIRAIAKAGFTTVQTSPVQQPKDYNPALTQVGSLWWKLYQPLGFVIGNESWLGTREELKELCSVAKTYGVKIIVDIVANHLAGGTDVTLNPNVLTYEPDIYNQNLIHADYKNKTGSVASEVYAPLGGYPDLQTENELVQSRVISLLKDCLDVGVSGFRFDATKHIATSTDGEYASTFWDNVLSSTTAYAKQTYNFNPYYYGEILGGLSGNRNMETYLNLMSVTDDATSGSLFSKSSSNNGLIIEALGSYSKTDDPSKVVLWVESHDTFAAAPDSAPALKKINKQWSIIANRKGATALYFAKPNYDKNTKTYLSGMGELGNDDFLEPTIIATNRFHNAFIGANEEYTLQNGYLIFERYREEDQKRGVIITNVSGKNDADLANITVKLADGTYKDHVSGNEFTVSGGKLSGKIVGGVAILYNDKTITIPRIPILTTSISSTKFYTDQEVKVEVELTAINTTSLTYQIDDGEELEYTGKITVTKECQIKVKAYNGELVKEKTIDINNFEYVTKKAGYIAIAGVSKEVLDTYKIFAWVWSSSGSTYKNVLIENGVVYVETNGKETGVLLVVYDKSYTLDSFKPINTWDSHLVTQTEDFLAPSQDICYDAKLN